MLALVDCYSEQFRQSFVNLIAHTDNGSDENLSSEMVSDVTASLKRATQEAARCALEKMVQSFESEGSSRTIERHGIEYRCSALLILVNTNTQVDFLRVVVFGIGRNQAQNRIWWYGLQMIKHGILSLQK